MSKYNEYTHLTIHRFSAHEALETLSGHIADATKLGWSELYIIPDDDYLCIMGVKPPDQEAIMAAKEKRRKQYERLKKEFEEQ